MFLDYAIEILAILCIAVAIYVIVSDKKKSKTSPFEESLASSLPKDFQEIKNLLTKEKEACEERERYLSQTIEELQNNLSEQTKLFNENKLSLEQDKAKTSQELSSLKEDYENLLEQKSSILSQKKSSEVRLGHIAETLAPFLDQFDFDPETCVFLGKPIDYISFGEKEISFIEVKSGNSKLNAKQRQIRDLIKSNSVSWKEVRIK